MEEVKMGVLLIGEEVEVEGEEKCGGSRGGLVCSEAGSAPGATA
jgi:hypothetical protein